MESCRVDCLLAIACRLKRDSIELEKMRLMGEGILRSEQRASLESATAQLPDGIFAAFEAEAAQREIVITGKDEKLALLTATEDSMVTGCPGKPPIELNLGAGAISICSGINSSDSKALMGLLSTESIVAS